MLASDEAIVAILAPEMHELNGLRALFEANGGSMKAELLASLVNTGIKGNLHDHARDVADDMVRRMRAVEGAKP